MRVRTPRPTLYVKSTLEGARVRNLLVAKGLPAEVVEITCPEQEDALAEINAEGVYPVLVDRELVVYGPALDEYVHERWPGPQLMPQEPIARAQARMLALWVKGWYGRSRQEQLAHLRGVEAVFQPGNKYFFGDQPTVVDIALAPLLTSGDFEPATTIFARYISRLTPDAIRLAA